MKNFAPLLRLVVLVALVLMILGLGMRSTVWATPLQSPLGQTVPDPPAEPGHQDDGVLVDEVPISDGGGDAAVPDGGGDAAVPDGGGDAVVPDGGGDAAVPDGGGGESQNTPGRPALGESADSSEDESSDSHDDDPAVEHDTVLASGAVITVYADGWVSLLLPDGSVYELGYLNQLTPADLMSIPSDIRQTLLARHVPLRVAYLSSSVSSLLGEDSSQGAPLTYASVSVSDESSAQVVRMPRQFAVFFQSWMQVFTNHAGPSISQ